MTSIRLSHPSIDILYLLFFYNIRSGATHGSGHSAAEMCILFFLSLVNLIGLFFFFNFRSFPYFDSVSSVKIDDPITMYNSNRVKEQTWLAWITSCCCSCVSQLCVQLPAFGMARYGQLSYKWVEQLQMTWAKDPASFDCFHRVVGTNFQ